VKGCCASFLSAKDNPVVVHNIDTVITGGQSKSCLLLLA